MMVLVGEKHVIAAYGGRLFDAGAPNRRELPLTLAALHECASGEWLGVSRAWRIERLGPPARKKQRILGPPRGPPAGVRKYT